MNYQEIFSKRISQLRKEKGLTLQRLADILEIKEPSVCAYESGKTFPSAHNLIALSKHFSVSLDYLTGQTDNPEINK